MIGDLRRASEKRTRQRRTTTATMTTRATRTTNTLIIISILVVARQSVIIRAQIDTNCLHADQNYAYQYLDTLIRLDQRLLAITGNRGLCLRGIPTPNWMSSGDIIANKLVVDDNIAENNCKSFKEFLSNAKILGSEEKTRIIQPIGSTTYYTFRGESAIRNESIWPSGIKFNVMFDHPDIGKWMKKVVHYQVEAMALLRKSSDSPKLPSALLVIADNKMNRVLKYYGSDPEKVSIKSYQVGLCLEEITAIYLDNLNYNDTIKPLVFFRNYFGRITVDISRKNSRTLLHPFPMLPMQSIFGCPTNLCWWPLVDDILYYDRAYFFFQGRWMFHMNEGDPVPKSMNDVRHVIRLATFGIDFTVRGAYFDFTEKTPMLVVRLAESTADMGYYLIPLSIATDPNNFIGFNIQLQRARYTQISMTTSEVQQFSVLTAFQIAEDPLVWIACHVFDQYRIRGYAKNTGNQMAAYTLKQEKPLPFSHLQAIFYNYNSKYLYAIDGFMLHVYERPEEMFDSRCIVTYAASFFNCSDEYYAQNKKMKKFSDRKQYFEEMKLRQSQSGALLPGKCNWRNNLPQFEAIQFTDKEINSQNDNDGDNESNGFLERFFHNSYTLMIVALGAGIGLTVALFYCATTCWNTGRRATNRESVKRRAREGKLKEFLKERYQGFMRTSINQSKCDTTDQQIGNKMMTTSTQSSPYRKTPMTGQTSTKGAGRNKPPRKR